MESPTRKSGKAKSKRALKRLAKNASKKSLLEVEGASSSSPSSMSALVTEIRRRHSHGGAYNVSPSGSGAAAAAPACRVMAGLASLNEQLLCTAMIGVALAETTVRYCAIGAPPCGGAR
jgi:hypothetical protein